MIYGRYSTKLDKFKLAREFEMDPSFNFSCQLRQLLARQPSRQAAKQVSRQSGSQAVRQSTGLFSRIKEKLSTLLF